MNQKLRKPLRALALALSATTILASCSAKVDMPQGKRGVYQSARLIHRNPASPAITKPIEKEVHGLIQKSIARQFTSHGMSYGKGDADLAIAYLVIYQEPGMTANFDDYFGYGRNAREIADVAHIRGSIESKRPDFFRQAGIVVDVVDNRTGKLVFRNFAKGDIIQGASSSTRAARIDQAVASALEPFFQ